ncbi:uncharacterized protein PV09_07740 [Verruconis gallopava]|uniref:gamma-glutamylcyclotransferase n=1 Tax=Verruconis gallopava TaxID=253628 RepID=A0A0D2ANP1_9PEZI|nr:uncharacterized protein PV09_07740 [Verruconis gallopava]KIW00759.1 hypothetical protein PV09_07740 [Verruconis gallopava]
MDRVSPLQLPRIDRSRSPSPMRDPRTLYIAYGINLHAESMKKICPGAEVVGIARLRHWRFQISSNGTANIVEAPPAPFSPDTAKWLGPLGGDLRQDKDRVYGVVYRLERDDEVALEKEMAEEGRGYEKELLTAEFWGRWQDTNGEWKPADLRHGRIQKIRAIVYVDRKNTTEAKSAANAEYLRKLNAGIKDAVAQGIPKGYFEEYVRPFLAMDEEEKALSLAIQDAMKKGVDVRRLLEKVEMEMATTNTSGDEASPQASL